ncbi:hypothetical protein [Salinibacterium sp. M195]|uniref:hypothetical protein n=1 Tax=Salinibacterium sp. M195 TaxID=2583374 RepID=UPI001C639650|nr:hypothetical protein [Salinibacterium sp. M195]
MSEVEKRTFDWLDWDNNRRLHSSLDSMPPGDYETNYYAETTGPFKRRSCKQNGGIMPGTVQYTCWQYVQFVLACAPECRNPAENAPGLCKKTS